MSAEREVAAAVDAVASPKTHAAKADGGTEHVEIDSNTTPTPPIGLTLQQFTDRTLDFLSTASNETIGACLVGLGASTYIVLGRVGLVLMGVVGGVVLHATWEGNAGPNAQGGQRALEEKRRKETGMDVINRVLRWRTDQPVNQDDEEEERSEGQQLTLTQAELDFEDFRPETADALRQITEAVVRDYVKWWYSPILPEEHAFPNASRETLTSFIRSISNNLARKRPADTFLNFVTNASSVVVVFFAELSAAIHTSPYTSTTEAVQRYLESKPESSLAHVMDRAQQKKKLHIVADDILQGYLEQKTYGCQPAQIFLREILSTTILNNLIESCSKPEFINDWLVYLLEDGEPQLLKKVDAGLEGSNGNVVEVAKKQLINGSAPAESARKGGTSASDIAHRRVVSKGQEAFDEAMRHVAELNRMIQEEDEKRVRSSSESMDEANGGTGQGLPDDLPLRHSIEKGFQQVPVRSRPDREAVGEEVDQGDLATAPQESGARVDASQTNEDNSTDTTATRSPEIPRLDTSTFTNFDQIVPNSADPDTPSEKEPLTVFRAHLTIFDDSQPGEKSSIKAKPQEDYLIQIEPASNYHSGWMVARKYQEFEPLHQAIFAISKISGAGFDQKHPTLPVWKGNKKAELRQSLERYLNDAVACQSIAESERMKRFLDRDQNLIKTPNKGNMFFENVGKGVMTGITTAGKEVAGGGKAIIGVFGGIAGPKKSAGQSQAANGQLPHNRAESIISSSSRARESTDNVSRASSGTREPRQSTTSPTLAKRETMTNGERDLQARINTAHGADLQSSKTPSPRRRHVKQQSMQMSPSAGGDEFISLPPPPSRISDDWDGTSEATATSSSEFRRNEEDSVFSDESTAATSTYDAIPSSPTEEQAPSLPVRPAKKRAEYMPLSEQETTVSIELLFAVITELYTLSSAWSLRRTLLNAAKTFLLRPGNPQLESIRQLIQSTALDANTSDAGIAAHLLKLRENSLPTQTELAEWPAERSDEEKDRLRIKARKLLVEKGMPVALTSVMGQAASGEALGKVFDCLQNREVARGLMFGLLLQGIRAVVQ